MTTSGPETRTHDGAPADADARQAPVDSGDSGTAEQSAGAPGAGTPARWWRRVPVDLVVAAVFLAGALLVTARGWRDVDGRLLGTRPDDQGFNEWMLAYAAHAVSHLENPFFTTLQNAPDGVNLMTNVGMQLPGLVLTPFTLLFGASFSYLLLITLNLAGTGYAWYHVLSRHVVRSRLAAFVGGVFCAFAPALVSHSNGHPHITAQWLVPFIGWRVLVLARHGRVVRDGLLLGVLIAAQFFVSLEILFLLALCCLMVVVAHLVVEPRVALRRAGRLAGGLAVAGSVVAVAAAYPLWMQFAGPQHRVGHPGAADVYALKLGSYVRYATESIAGSPTSASGWGPNTTEQASFYGWSLLVVALAAAWWLRREVTVRVLALVAVFCGLLSIGTTWTWGTERTRIPAPFALVEHLPVFDSVVVARFALITTGAIGVLLALAGDRLVARSRAGQPGDRLLLRLAGVATVAALLPILPTPLAAQGRQPVPHFVTGGAWRDHVAPGRTLVPVPVVNMTSVYWSSAALAGFAVPQGYFLAPVSKTDATGRWGVEPQPTAKLLTEVAAGRRGAAVTPAEIAQARADARYWRADAVALPAHRRQAELRSVLDALYGPGRRVDDVWLWDVRPFSR
ncbi:hypothetical protein GCE86_03960 [Micromonospora terminaliae]|uniref:DUF6311 domain-containing protein n=1 Tax=Micromonospora terminaliae TaxID=1914461 RepID=A0AAJ2ZLH2_9ACTN|nr:hypothetical protein [Micromonospora terminaliae]NES31034.1 hypothetical protein [Micromonospora terminaliae]QGL46277.1 hypothetical protein GCE86_03960 [Micromonospora terminaliae]